MRRWYAESRRDLQDEKQLELGEQREQVRTNPYPYPKTLTPNPNPM